MSSTLVQYFAITAVHSAKQTSRLVRTASNVKSHDATVKAVDDFDGKNADRHGDVEGDRHQRVLVDVSIEEAAKEAENEFDIL